MENTQARQEDSTLLFPNYHRLSHKNHCRQVLETYILQLIYFAMSAVQRLGDRVLTVRQLPDPSIWNLGKSSVPVGQEPNRTSTLPHDAGQPRMTRRSAGHTALTRSGILHLTNSITTADDHRLAAESTTEIYG